MRFRANFSIEVAADPFYSKDNMEELERRIADIKSGRSEFKEHELVEGRLMKKIWDNKAWKEYLQWQSRDKAIIKKINKFLQDIDRNGYNGIGKPETFGILKRKN